MNNAIKQLADFFYGMFMLSTLAILMGIVVGLLTFAPILIPFVIGGFVAWLINAINDKPPTLESINREYDDEVCSHGQSNENIKSHY